MFIPYFTAVVISAIYCPKLPSPETETTLRPAKRGSSSWVAAHIHRNDGIVGHRLGELIEDRGRVDPHAAVFGAPP